MQNLKPTGKKYGRFILFFDHLPDGEPCLCLGSRTVRDIVPGFVVPNSVKSKRSAFVIPLKMAYLYAESKSGGPSPYLVQRAFLIADHLGLDHEKSTIRNIIDAIIDGIQDLISMPPIDTTITKHDLENKADRQGLVVKIDGETVLDAS